MKTVYQYYVYILASKIRGTLYVGMTNDLQKKVYEHKKNDKKGFTQKYGIHKFVYFENFEDVTETISKERNLKKWKRDWKIQLIQE